MLRIRILICLVFFAKLINGQVSSYVNLDENFKDLISISNQKKYDAALSLVNKSIVDDPKNGVNYFNRAVISYYKKPKSYKTIIINGKKESISSYDTAIVNDCKRALEKGYSNSELFYLVFLQYYNYDPKGPGNRYSLKDGFGYEAIGYYEQRTFIDSAIKIKPWNEKYISARFELYISREIVTTFFEVYKEKDALTISSDCERIVRFTKDNRRKFLAYYYLSRVYSEYYKDTLKAINYLSLAIELNSIYKFKNPSKKDFDNIYDNLYAERGLLRQDLEDFEGAILDFNIHLSKWEDGEIYLKRAWANLITDKLSNAYDDVTKAIAIYEQERKNNLTSQGSMAKIGIEIYEARLGGAFLLRGLINQELKNMKEALKDFNRAIEYGDEEAINAKKKLLEISSINDETQSTKPTSYTNSVVMVKNGGVYEIPITINNTLKINFIFDAGAADVSISPDVALTLIRTGTVKDKDFIGTTTYRFADGSTAKSKVFILKELQIGTRKVTNVKASISNSLDAPLLLGQSALNRFGKVTIDYKNNLIHFED